MERADAVRLALREIHGNLTFTDNAAWAWFALPTQPWAFRSDRQRESLLVGGGDTLASLAGHRLRSHGGIAEQTVPFLLSRPVLPSYREIAQSRRLRNFDILDFALNGVAP